MSTRTPPGPAPTQTLPLVEQFQFGLDAPICLTWELTYACNLACVHCLSSSGRRDPRELSTAEAKHVVDELQKLRPRAGHARRFKDDLGTDRCMTLTHDVAPAGPSAAPGKLTDLFQLGLDAPICLTWELTYACNLSCVHCLSSSGRRDPRELTTAEAKAVIDELERMQVFYVNIGGGEPTVRSDFWELVDYATAHKVGVKFSTNGVRLDAAAAVKLAASDYVDVQISLDGATREVNDAVRGPGSFDTAITALRNLSDAGFRDAKISVVCTRQNIGQLDEFKALADAFGATLRLTRLRPSGRGVDVWDELHAPPVCGRRRSANSSESRHTPWKPPGERTLPARKFSWIANGHAYTSPTGSIRHTTRPAPHRFSPGSAPPNADRWKNESPVSTCSPCATSQSYSSRCCSGSGCSSSHTSAPRPDGRSLVSRSCAPRLSASAWNWSSWPALCRVTTTEILKPTNPASASRRIARSAVSYDPGPRTASFTSAVAPSREICTST